MNNLLDTLRAERDRYLKNIADVNAAAESDSSFPFPIGMVDHDQGMADGLDRAINIINQEQPVEEDYMAIRWNQVEEHMSSSYHSRRRIYDRVLHHDLNEFEAWMNTKPRPGDHIVLRSMVIIRVQ